MNMSFAELFNTLFFAAIGLLAWLVPIPLNRRISSCAIGACGLAVCLLLASTPAFLPEQANRQLRAWAPLLLILVAYH